MRKFAIAAAAGLCLAPAAISSAQQPNLQDILSNIPINVPLQTQRARATYLGPDFWSDLAPATYVIRMPGTNLCLTRTFRSIRAEMDHIRLRTCQIDTPPDGLTNANQLIQAAPGAVDVPPAQGFSNVRWRFTTRNECAGAARNVWVGSPRVDFNTCDLMPYAGGDVAHRGAPDQLFFIRRTSALGAILRFQIRSAERKCWTVQGGEIRDGTPIVMEDCDGRAGQTFEFRYNMPLMDQAERSAADKFGWLDAPTVNRENSSADRFRDLPAINIASEGYSSTATADDAGTDCAASCRIDDNCRAFTWTPRSATSGPMCRLTQTFWPHEMVEAPGTNSGIMRP